MHRLSSSATVQPLGSHDPPGPAWIALLLGVTASGADEEMLPSPRPWSYKEAALAWAWALPAETADMGKPCRSSSRRNTGCTPRLPSGIGGGDRWCLRQGCRDRVSAGLISRWSLHPFKHSLCTAAVVLLSRQAVGLSSCSRTDSLSHGDRCPATLAPSTKMHLHYLNRLHRLGFLFDRGRRAGRPGRLGLGV